MQSENFEIIQLSTPCLAQFAYLIQSGNECAVIDPLRDIDEILELIEKENLKLKYIILTHFHADFVSGHFELQRKTGADILIGPNNISNKVI